LWLEGHTVSFATLIAHNLEPFALSSATLAWTAKILATRIAAWLAAFRVRQSSLAIIILLSFGKGKARAAFGTRDL